MVQASYPIIHASDAASVPETPGVYALENTITGHFYAGTAGNLRQRYRNWHSLRNATAAKLRAACSIPLASALATAPPEGWRFVVLVTSEVMPKAERLSLESKAIARAIEAKGELCLNTERGTDDGRAMRYGGRLHDTRR